MEIINNSKRDKKYYVYASTLLSQDSTHPTALFIKASILDARKDYQAAIILYDKVAELSPQKGMHIYSAIAKRKKNGL